MAWCPNCKVEYRDGITICNDCKAELVESLDKEMDTPIINSGNPELIAKLRDYLAYNNIKSEMHEDGQLIINNKDVDAAKKLTAVFLQQETIRAFEEGEFDETDEEETEDEQEMIKSLVSSQNDNVYRDKRDKAKDFESSAYALLFVGVAGIIFVVLMLLKVIPFELPDNLLLKIVMPLIFVGCLVMGVKTKKESKKYVRQAEEEEELKVRIMKWCEDTLTAQLIDDLCAGNGEDTETDALDEMLYFNRCDVIKQKLNSSFINLEPAFQDFMVDECYRKLYEA